MSEDKKEAEKAGSRSFMDLDEAVGEHMLEEATDELLGGEGARLELVSGRLFVSESDLVLMEFVGDSGRRREKFAHTYIRRFTFR